jgi:SAM-dependent methyltransferase
MTLEKVPPAPLTARFGGAHEDYAEIGAQHLMMLRTMLPDDWSWQGKRVLDFGCGAGRTMQALAPEAQGAELWGCDIHREGIEWATEHLSPPMRFLANDELPPLDVAAASFDLVYGMSVFTHITDDWAAWAAEIHRILAPGGLGIFTFLGEGMWKQILGRPWEPERIGMISTKPGRSWAVGGPDVYTSEWWLREHWGRGFEVVAVRPATDLDAMAGHGWLVVRRDERACDVEELGRIDPSDPRELASLKLNVEILSDEGRELRQELEQSGGNGDAEHARLADELRVVLGSRSWQLTAPLRRLGRAARRR